MLGCRVAYKFDGRCDDKMRLRGCFTVCGAAGRIPNSARSAHSLPLSSGFEWSPIIVLVLAQYTRKRQSEVLKAVLNIFARRISHHHDS